MPTLTIFTPAYNRKHTIGRTYEHMCKQTCHDVLWLIVDDGSSDGTRDLVRTWYDYSSLQETSYEMTGYSKDAAWLNIHYIYQQNQGMHGAHNTAYEHITTELNTCIDSDDYAPDDCVEKIVNFWKSQTEENRNKYAGIVGLDFAIGGGLIGTAFPEGMIHTNMTEFYDKGGRGDKKIVYRTEVVKKYPKYPIFKGEKYVCLATLYFMIDQDYDLLTLNEPLDIVEYQLDGSSLNMYKQYMNNPHGTIYDRTLVLKHNPPLKKRFKYCMHFIASKTIAKEFDYISTSPAPITTFFALPFGILEYAFIVYKFKNNKLMKIR